MAWFHIDNDLKIWTLYVSVAALCIFLLGYLFSFRLLRRPLVAPHIAAMSNDFAFKATVALAIPALIVGGRFAWYRAGLAYGAGHDISGFTQAILYLHMFFAYLFIGSVATCKGKDKRKILWAVALVLTPRILITLHWARFFAGQTVVAILFIALARGWLKMSLKRWVQLLLIAMLIFLGPILTRDSAATRAEIVGGGAELAKFFSQGSTLNFFQDYHDDLKSTCPPLLVSFTERIIPYNLLGVCTIQVGSIKGVPATVPTLLTRATSDDLALGSGSIYLFGLYLLGGVPAIMVGSLLFGLCCRWWVERLGYASVFAGIWAECLVRSLFAPRGSLGYAFQRIPSLLLATFGVILLCQLMDIMQRRQKTLALDGGIPGATPESPG